MYRAKTSHSTFEIEINSEGYFVNGESAHIDLVKVAEGYFHIITGTKSYQAEVVKADVATKSFIIKVNGRVHTVELKDKFDLLLDKMGMSSQASSRINTIKAPMPGLIIEMKVKDNDSVKAGDPLLILEAMKMENIIKSPGDGIVKAVRVKKGDSVEKNQVLIEF